MHLIAVGLRHRMLQIMAPRDVIEAMLTRHSLPATRWMRRRTVECLLTACGAIHVSNLSPDALGARKRSCKGLTARLASLVTNRPKKADDDPKASQANSTDGASGGGALAMSAGAEERLMARLDAIEQAIERLVSASADDTDASSAARKIKSFPRSFGGGGGGPNGRTRDGEAAQRRRVHLGTCTEAHDAGDAQDGPAVVRAATNGSVPQAVPFKTIPCTGTGTGTGAGTSTGHGDGDAQQAVARPTGKSAAAPRLGLSARRERAAGGFSEA